MACVEKKLKTDTYTPRPLPSQNPTPPPLPKINRGSQNSHPPRPVCLVLMPQYL